MVDFTCVECWPCGSAIKQMIELQVSEHVYRNRTKTKATSELSHEQPKWHKLQRSISYKTSRHRRVDTWKGLGYRRWPLQTRRWTEAFTVSAPRLQLVANAEVTYKVLKYYVRGALVNLHMHMRIVLASVSRDVSIIIVLQKWKFSLFFILFSIIWWSVSRRAKRRWSCNTWRLTPGPWPCYFDVNRVSVCSARVLLMLV